MDRANSGSYSFLEKMEDMNDTELANVRNKEMGLCFKLLICWGDLPYTKM